MKTTPRLLCLLPILLLLVSLVPSAAVADAIWACVDQVSVDSYTDYLQNYLYTSTGDNRDNHQPDHTAARENIYTLFSSYGLDTTIQSGMISGYQYNNVVGVHLGTTNPDEIYVIGAHYDSVGNPGADDNASGVAGVLEAARVLSQYSSAATIVFIAFDREEDGLWGSRAYAQGHAGDNIQGMISLDMIGYNPGGLDQAWLYGRAGSSELKNDLAGALATYGGITASIGGQLDASDHAPFEWAGFQATVLIERNWTSNPYYHLPQDSTDTAGYIDYDFARNMTAGAVGYLAGQAGIETPEPATLGLLVPALLALRLRTRGGRRRTTVLRWPG